MIQKNPQNAAYFSVVDFSQYQHYRNRTPPWIKLYNRLLDDYAFCHLPDASKYHALAITLLASRHDNKVPADPLWVAQRIGATEPVDLNILAEAGFIAFHGNTKADQSRSKTLASCKQNAMPEREGETETETENNNINKRQVVDCVEKSEDQRPEPIAPPPPPAPPRRPAAASRFLTSQGGDAIQPQSDGPPAPSPPAPQPALPETEEKPFEIPAFLRRDPPPRRSAAEILAESRGKKNGS